MATISALTFETTGKSSIWMTDLSKPPKSARDFRAYTLVRRSGPRPDKRDYVLEVWRSGGIKDAYIRRLGRPDGVRWTSVPNKMAAALLRALDIDKIDIWSDVP